VLEKFVGRDAVPLPQPLDLASELRDHGSHGREHKDAINVDELQGVAFPKFVLVAK
jgi:hypothetical protein